VENLTPPGVDFRTVQNVVSLYTDWAIPAHRGIRYVGKIDGTQSMKEKMREEE
jgi:hypothetical protein